MFNNINLITESLTKSSLKGPSPKVVQWLAAIFTSLLLYIYREPIFTMLSLARDKEGLIAYLEQFGGWAPALLFIVIMLQVVVAAIPGFLLMIVGGYLYGFSGGFLISYATTVITSMATFYAARAFGRKITNRFANTRAIKNGKMSLLNMDLNSSLLP